jgi:hypothetical protein
MYSPEHLQHGRLAAASGSKNKINKAAVQALDSNLFDELRFVNKIGAQLLAQVRKKRRAHDPKVTAAVVHCWLIVGREIVVVHCGLIVGGRVEDE